ncbi:hypothetical protein F6455_01640 [Proteobacteria bacterium 005FR1]|nr:hypothetical protein [Proteobacteria bacterium 005FR1]
MLKRIAIIAAGTVLTACAGSPGEDLPPFGETVMAIKEAQTWNEGDAVPTLTGERGTRSLEAYRNRGAEGGRQATSETVEIGGK